eukprot:764925-Hanusia_phi.AAC.2
MGLRPALNSGQWQVAAFRSLAGSYSGFQPSVAIFGTQRHVTSCVFSVKRRMGSLTGSVSKFFNISAGQLPIQEHQPGTCGGTVGIIMASPCIRSGNTDMPVPPKAFGPESPVGFNDCDHL